jgi:hypothetical protein
LLQLATKSDFNACEVEMSTHVASWFVIYVYKHFLNMRRNQILLQVTAAILLPVLLHLKLSVIRQTANARQSKILRRYQAIKSKCTCCFKTAMHYCSFDTRKKIWNENVQHKFCQEISNLPFAVPGNVKLNLLIIKHDYKYFE